ncbi:uncharacterized protein [Battus philenor]|uniref:uncharacterized protein n=1 Tax=Battus philenor TaxID=42288 RepID=UPI0035CE98C4
MRYGSETWSLKIGLMERVQVDREMEIQSLLNHFDVDEASYDIVKIQISRWMWAVQDPSSLRGYDDENYSGALLRTKLAKSQLLKLMERIYFVKSEKSPRSYSGWTCGGALVNAYFILTSAACVEDVHHLYAIGGYKKFVHYEDLDKDPCTKKLKKKVIYTCVPKAYDFDHGEVEKWSAIDIGLARVDSAFKLYPDYESLCSYMPERIPVNYDPTYQTPGLDAIVMGWGHLEKWRQNDHGGPLVTWVGGREYVIGVASVFRVNADSQCEGPYLYTSTQCNGAFISCVIKPKSRRYDPICDLPPKERGFDMVHKYISWINHTDGPADNERIQIRPQVPIRDFA